MSAATHLIVLLCASAALAAPPVLPPLTVRGKEILAGEKPIVLRGVALGDPILGRAGRPMSDYETIAKDWRANVVRLSIHPGVWNKTPHDKVIATLKENVAAAQQSGLYTIICWHAIGWPDGYTQESSGSKELYDSRFAKAKEFWTAMAGAFGGDGRVLFELWNEPTLAADDYKEEFGAKWNLLRPYWQELTELIRKRGDNVVIASGNRWAFMLKGVRDNPLAGKNIAYAWHVYAGHWKDDTAAWAKHLDEVQTVAPVIVTEWGFQRDTDQHYKGTPDSFADKFVREFLDGRSLHSTAWVWHPDWGPPMLKSDWRTPNEFGQYVHDYLHRKAK